MIVRLTLLLFLAVAAGCQANAVPVPELSSQRAREFDRIDSDGYAGWLHDVEEDLTCSLGNVQLYLVGAAPGEQASVLAQPADDNGNAPAANWPAPWPAVQKAVTGSVTEPTTVRDTYQGHRYEHRLIPLDAAGRLCLVITRAVPKEGWVNSMTVLLASGLLAAVAMYVRVRT
jgi:hypothetical protein